MTTQTQRVPALRFPEFSGKWEEKKLGDVATFSKGKGVSKSDISIDGLTKCIRYGELYTEYGETIRNVISRTNVPVSDLVLSLENDVIIPASGETQIDIATASAVLSSGIALGGDLNIIRTTEVGVFIAYYLNNTKKYDIARLAQGISVVHLYSSQLKILNIMLPPLPEQRKIASFLSLVDTKIDQLTKKKAKLGKYKKGMMQKLFSQEIRFKDEEGKEYPDWEEKKLGELFDRVRSKNTTNNKNILTISAQQGLVNQLDYYNHRVAAKDTSGYYLLDEGDFAYNKSYSKGYPMGATKRLKCYKNGVVSTLYICFRPKCADVGNFYEWYFESGCQNRYLTKIAQEGARNHGLLNMAIGDYFSMPLPLPHPNEQKKIADFLSSIDDKIERVGKELEKAKTFKKGLLQQMFV